MVRIYFSQVEKMLEAEGLLNDESIKEIEATKNTELRKQKTIVRLLLSVALKDCGYKEKIYINKTSDGKPYLESGKPFFSFAHTPGLIVCAVSDNEVGIDVEKSKDYSDAVIKSTLSICEMDAFCSLSKKEKNEIVCVSWTLKEGYVKLIGSGIKKRPSQIILKNYALTDLGKTFDRVIDGKNIFFCFNKIKSFFVSCATFLQENIQFFEVDEKQNIYKHDIQS